MNNAKKSGKIEEVIVTARRRAENLEKVPATIEVLGAAQLAKREIHSEADLQRSVPGLTIRVTQSSNQINYAIRGQTIDQYSSSQPGVLSYVNEVQVNSLSASSFYDLSNIQVLKGPQGTLFGRNTTGGAVLYATAKPTDGYSGFIQGRFGNYADKEGEGYVNFPIVADKVLLRLAGRINSEDGYVTNLTTGGTAGTPDLGIDHSQSGRATLLLRPFTDFENETVVQINHSAGTDVGGSLYSLTPCGAPGLSSAVACLYSPVYAPGLFNAYAASNPQAGQFPGGIAQFFAVQKARGPYLVNHDEPSPFQGQAQTVSNTTTWSPDPDLTLKNIFGWSHTSNHQFSDTDGTPFTIFNLGPFDAPSGYYITDTQWSEELQLQGKAFNRNLTYVLGGYYSHEDLINTFSQIAFQELPYLPAGATLDNFTQTYKSEAAFAQGSYDLSGATGLQGLKITGGVRYTWEQVNSTQLPGSAFPGPELGKQFSDPSWTDGVDYQVTNKLLLYVVNRGSWRSGGFNAYQAPSPLPGSQGGSFFPSETTVDVEVGAKFQGEVLGQPLRLNVDLYDQWIKNVQRVVYVLEDNAPTATTASVPAAEVKGFEADFQYVPLPWLTVGGNLAYSDAEFTQNEVRVFGVKTIFGPYPDTPKWTGSVFAEIAVPVPAEWGDVTFRVDTYAQTKNYFSSTAATISPGSELPGYSLTNLRLSWNNIAKSRFSAALFATDVFDKTYYQGGLGLASIVGINEAIPGRPRTFGGEVSFKF